MMFENLKIQIVEVFENEFKNRIQDFINDGCEIDNVHKHQNQKKLPKFLLVVFISSPISFNDCSQTPKPAI